MIEFLKEYIINLTGVIVFGSVCELIMPDNNYKKYIRLVIGLILCITLILPISKNKKIDFDEFKIENIYIDESLKSDKADNDKVLELYQKKIVDMFEKEIKKCTDLKTDIVCDISSGEKDFGSIKSVTVNVDGKKDETLKKSICGILSDKFSIEKSDIRVVFLK